MTGIIWAAILFAAALFVCFALCRAAKDGDEILSPPAGKTAIPQSAAQTAPFTQGSLGDTQREEQSPSSTGAVLPQEGVLGERRNDDAQHLL